MSPAAESGETLISPDENLNPSPLNTESNISEGSDAEQSDTEGSEFPEETDEVVVEVEEGQAVGGF